MINPTDRQNQILNFVQNFLLYNPAPPTYSQIALEVGITSRAGVHGHIKRMEKKGLLKVAGVPNKRLGLFDLTSA
jgi:repressor LexA